MIFTCFMLVDFFEEYVKRCLPIEKGDGLTYIAINTSILILHLMCNNLIHILI